VIVSIMILVSSLAMFLMYLQAACESILRREFDPVRLRLTVNAWRLEFQFVQKEMADTETQADYGWVRRELECDYIALTYLLKDAGTANYSRRERILMLYFRALSLTVSVQHSLKLDEKRTILKLTGILNYFANVLSASVNEPALVRVSA
jgi:hypothetical protein